MFPTATIHFVAVLDQLLVWFLLTRLPATLFIHLPFGHEQVMYTHHWYHSAYIVWFYATFPYYTFHCYKFPFLPVHAMVAQVCAILFGSTAVGTCLSRFCTITRVTRP